MSSGDLSLTPDISWWFFLSNHTLFFEKSSELLNWWKKKKRRTGRDLNPSHRLRRPIGYPDYPIDATAIDWTPYYIALESIYTWGEGAYGICPILYANPMDRIFFDWRMSFFGVRFSFVFGRVWTHEKNQPRIGALANLWFALRFGSSTLAWIPLFGRSESDLLFLTWTRRVDKTRRFIPSSGPFGQILSPPQRLMKKL